MESGFEIPHISVYLTILIALALVCIKCLVFADRSKQQIHQTYFKYTDFITS